MDSNNQLIYKGFDIPEGAIIEPNPGKGKLNGEYTIYDSNKNNVIAKLQYKKNQLSGDCQLFESPQIFEKRPYLKDIANGWGIVYENDKETKRYLYKDGKRIIMLEQEKETKFKRETDCQNGHLLSFCEYDDKFNRINTGYMFKDNKIEKACIFVNGKENRIVKEFHDNNMTEYNENGVVVYKGEYLDSIESEYCRNGKGDEYEDNCILYSGEWKNNKREGFGRSYRKNVLVYEGYWHENIPHGAGAFFDKDEKRIDVEGSDFKVNKYDVWKTCMDNLEHAYMILIKLGATPQEARSILPNSLKTEIVITAQVYEWIHIFNLRVLGTTGAPHPQIKEVMEPAYNEMIENGYLR